MDLRRLLLLPVMRALDRPRVREVLADPRAVDLFVAIVRTQERVATFVRALRSRRRNARTSS